MNDDDTRSCHVQKKMALVEGTGEIRGMPTRLIRWTQILIHR